MKPTNKAQLPVPTESAEQQALFHWARIQGGKVPELRLMYHIPNGGQRGQVTAAILKAEGVKSGVPDIHLPVARGGYHGLYIELKRRKGGRVSIDQKKWLADLEAQGYCCAVCRGFEEARERILAYLRAGGERTHGA